ncbi:MAG: Fic family protein [Paracoccaceae bacterium]|nr:Fic family protein [Paracoccaceae bacterium]
MARRIDKESFQAIEAVVGQRPEGMDAPEIAAALDASLPRRTLQYRLKALVDDKRLMREGSGRWARYRLPEAVTVSVGAASLGMPSAGMRLTTTIPLSEAGKEIRNYVRQPEAAREPVGYDRNFLDCYRPNASFYLSERERMELLEFGMTEVVEQPAGTYAGRVLNRLLIDLSWNSSRLEGNTYSLLDTMRLIELGEEAEGKDWLEAQMILNHRDAIEILVDGAEDIGFDRHTVLNLHAALSDNILADPEAPGRLRHMGVGIHGSVIHPLEAPQLIEECFEQILTRASLIEDPFEQALFAMVQLPYLQPFDDVNKRVSRLAANIPLIRANLSPLSFEGLPRELYTEAILGVYELKRIELLRDVFMWAYRRSAARYSAVRMSLGEPDPFRWVHRMAIREPVGDVVRQGLAKRAASTHIAEWVAEHIEDAEHERFRDVVERELLSLHEGNFSRYRIRPSEFAAWKTNWSN